MEDTATSASKPCRVRSQSVSSVHPSDSFEDSTKRRRKSSPKDRHRKVSPLRKGRDLYIPKYRNLHNSRVEASNEGKSSTPKSKATEKAHAQVSELAKIQAERKAKEEENAKEGPTNASDIEDIISLGGLSDIEVTTAPVPSFDRSEAVPPVRHINIIGRGRNERCDTPVTNRGPPSSLHGQHSVDNAKVRHHMPTLAIATRSNIADDYDNVPPDTNAHVTSSAPTSATSNATQNPRVLQRVTANQQPLPHLSTLNRQKSEARFSHAKASIPPSPGEGSIRKVNVNPEVKSRLLARLEEEMKRKLKESVNINVTASQTTSNTERVLRQSVLDLLRSRKSSKAVEIPPVSDILNAGRLSDVISVKRDAPLSSTSTPLKAEATATNRVPNIQAAAPEEEVLRNAVLGTHASTPVPEVVKGKSSELRSRVEKEKRLAKLHSKLLAEKLVSAQA